MEGDFFGKWDFISADDPTHGFVDYVTAEKAVAENLVRTTENGAWGIQRRFVKPRVYHLPGSRTEGIFL